MKDVSTTNHRVYVASSWRNAIQPDVVAALRQDGHDVYDFRNPVPGDSGFSWRQLELGDQSTWTPEVYATKVLDHPIAAKGFELDMVALESASAVVLVLPCGRSAHLELGYAAGRGKLTIVYVPSLDEPELMYRMCDYLETTLEGVRRQLSQARTPPRWQRDLAKAAEGSESSWRFRECRDYFHRECAVCRGCWRHGSCTCGPVMSPVAGEKT